MKEHFPYWDGPNVPTSPIVRSFNPCKPFGIISNMIDMIDRFIGKNCHIYIFLAKATLFIYLFIFVGLLSRRGDAIRQQTCQNVAGTACSVPIITPSGNEWEPSHIADTHKNTHGSRKRSAVSPSPYKPRPLTSSLSHLSTFFFLHRSGLILVHLVTLRIPRFRAT